ncbi:hypothetical protein [Idiomarina sp. ST10R2A5]|uniref:hypothetical protein n=1 Tax=Idiomarina sp. ST10R2A5 TaxID=3418368 RepID=UPI003EC5AF59
MVKWIKAIWNVLSRTQSVKTEPEPIEETEIVTRYITSSGNMKASGVKHQAFFPRPDPNYGMSTSVFRCEKMTEEEVSENHSGFELKAGHKIKGLAKIKVDDICAIATEDKSYLDVVPEESDWKWHADIVGWPQNDKSQSKLLCMELAKKSVLDKV